MAEVDFDKTKLLYYIQNFHKGKILVIGDLMVDEFIWGKVRRISPEAPVPIVEVVSQSYGLGGAANVVNNIYSLEGKVSVVGIVGDDAMGQILLNQLHERNISTAGIIIDKTRPTTLKTRIIAHNQQVVRVDREKTNAVDEFITARMIEYVEQQIDNVSAIIIEDYGKGVITPSLLKEVIQLAHQKGKLVTVDPKTDHFLYYKGVDVITPNTDEAGAMLGVTIKNEKELLSVGKRMVEMLGGTSVLITRGEQGMSLFEKDGSVTHLPTTAREVYDVCGAGDTVIATLTLVLAVGGSIKEAAFLSNYAAGIVVGKVGVATVSKQELIQAIQF